MALPDPHLLAVKAVTTFHQSTVKSDPRAVPVYQAIRDARAESDWDASMIPIEELRHQLEQNEEVVRVMDHGAGSRTPEGRPLVQGSQVERRISELAKTASMPAGLGRILFHLVRHLKPSSSLELGTCLGVSGAYLSAGIRVAGSGALTTIEGDPTLAQLAAGNLSAMGYDETEIRIGRFADVVPDLLAAGRRFDFAHVDGHHEEQAVLDYTRLLVGQAVGPVCIVLDDLFPRPSGVYRAFRTLQRELGDWLFMDLFRIGVILSPGAD